MFIDTHAHLNDPAFDKDRDETIKRAFDFSVEKIIDVGIDIATSRLSVQIAERYDAVYATVGFHPHDASKFSVSVLEEMELLASHEKVVAIGETGLDFYRNFSPRDLQITAFREQIQLAKRLKLPLVIHNRASVETVLTILQEEKAEELSGVLHCYSGSMDSALEAIGLNFYVGFNGPVTYKNSRSLEIACSLPMERIILETDSPYLAPEPYRGKRNEPAFIPLIAAKLAERGAVSLESIAQITSINASCLFNIDLRKRIDFTI